MNSKDVMTAPLSEGSREYLKKILELGELMDSIAELLRKDCCPDEKEIEDMYAHSGKISNVILQYFADNIGQRMGVINSMEL